VGALQAAARLGRGFRNVVSLGSLSKRSSVPGLRSGYAAGDSDVLAAFLHYRTYSGSAMGPPAQAASIAAFDDDAYVVANRAAYRRKLAAFHALVAPVAALSMPDGGFYFWMPTPGEDLTFVQRLYAEENVKVLPGSFFGRDGSGADGGANPGSGRVRISMTAPYDECVEGAKRIAALLSRRSRS
jgi:N-succinyldiaminopimelate aminotransferase